MPKLRFRAKRVHKIKFADGKIFTILNVDPDPQTGDVTLYLRQHIGIEVFIIPALMLVGVAMGWMAYSYVGAFAGAMIAGLGGIVMMSQMDLTMQPTKRVVPKSSIIGFDSYFQLKERSYCFCCMPSSESVICNPSIKSIDRVSIGDEVLTHGGNFNKVTRLFKRRYEGECIKITPSNINFPFILTPEHPVYSVRKESLKRKTYKNSGYWRKDMEKNPEWIEANLLKKGDYLAYPIVKGVLNVDAVELSNFFKPNKNKGSRYEFIDGSWARTNPSGSKQDIPNTVRVDDEFMEFSGWYVAEGCSSVAGCVTITLGAREKAIGERLAFIIRKKFNAHTYMSDRGSYFQLHFNCLPVAVMLRELFGRNVYEKTVPAWFLKLPLDKQAIFLKALFQGDGCVTKSGYIAYSTASRQLSFMVLQLCLRQGYYLSFGEYVQKNKYSQKNNSKRYMFSMTKAASKVQAIYRNDSFFIRIKKIERVPFSGNVFNLEVENDNSYATLGGAVHNCHNYDSNGNPVMEGTDPISIMSKRHEELEWKIRFLLDEIATLRYNLTQSQKTSKELVDETASGLKKLIESTVGQVRDRKREQPYQPYYPEYPPEQEEGEG